MKSPWDEETIDRLNAMQNEHGLQRFHPYTCGNNSNHILIATADGWKCPVEGCGYTQNWAHDLPVNL